MTTMTLSTVIARTKPSGRFRELLRTVRLRANPEATAPGVAYPHATALLTTTAEPWTARGVLTLALHDGVERQYLLDPRDFAATTSPLVAYDARVHAAYILAIQGHRPEWLAPHLDLPLAATHAISRHADRHGPNGPANVPGTDQASCASHLASRAWVAGH